ncbi:MAG: NADPH-dependent FMN reductase [Opitutales bacterium]
MKIVIISGTNRAGAQSRRLAERTQGFYAESGADVQLLDMAHLPVEVLLGSAYKEKPPAFVEGFIEPVLAADGLHVIVPEYNGSFPGVLKLFIDLLPFPEAFERRPTAYTGIAAGKFGALRAVEQLQMVFGYRNAFNYPERVFIPAAYGVFGEHDAFIDPDLEARLRRQANGFREYVDALRPVRERPLT